MSAPVTHGDAELLARRDALVAEIRALASQRAEAADQLLLAERDRFLREEKGPDSANVHVRGFLRDLARTLDDARRDLSRALRDAEEHAARAVRAQARRRALESLLARMASALEDGAR